MFRVSTNIEETIVKKKKLLFISTLSSNETSSFEPKIFEKQTNQYKVTPKSSSLSEPIESPKKQSNILERPNDNHINHKIFPMKRIMFCLYKDNSLNSKKDKRKIKSQNKKENNYKKNGYLNLKHKQKYLPYKNNNSITFNNKFYSAGRWKNDEHQRFIDAIIKYGNNWKQVQKYVGTRSSTQTRSHAQKFFEKLKRSKIFKKEKYDFSKNSLKLLHDIMHNLSKKDYEETLKALHSLSYERNSSSDNEINVFQQNNSSFINVNAICNDNENEKKNIEKNNGGNDVNEENIKCIKFLNQGYCFLESNNNKLYNYDDYLFYNNSSNGNINSNMNYNNYLINEYLNNDIKTFEIKESDIYSQRKNSLSEMNMNVKDSKEQNNNNSEENNFDYNINPNIINNNLNLNIQQENKNLINKIFENNDDLLSYRNESDNIDYLFNQINSRKMSLEEKMNC